MTTKHLSTLYAFNFLISIKDRDHIFVRDRDGKGMIIVFKIKILMRFTQLYALRDEVYKYRVLGLFTGTEKN